MGHRNIFLLLVILVELCLVPSFSKTQRLKQHTNTINKLGTAEGTWDEVGSRTNQVKPSGTVNNAKISGDGPKQKWNYTNVRPDAFMFWWLYYTTHADGYQHRPLVIWLQGGPGASSTGFGNFQEIGPETVQLKPRQSTWLQEVSLLFVDNPVGTGFSYVTNQNAYATNVSTIGSDLVTMMNHFLKEVPDFQTIPVYVFSESYGGKMAAAFSSALDKAVKAGLKCDFRGFAMGDSWISPIDSVLTWGPYLFSTSLVDEVGLKAVNDVAKAAKDAVDKEQWEAATALWSKAEDVVSNYTNGVNFYNIINQTPSLDRRILSKYDGLARKILPAFEQDLDQLMNGPIRKKLGIIPKNVTWGGQSGDVFKMQTIEFMKPVIQTVDELLQDTSLKVVVYSGQLDLIVDTVGTEMWVQRLKWAGLPQYNQARRTPLLNDKGETSAFVKRFKNFSFYWIMDSGHMVPADQPETALQVLRMIVKD